MLALLMEAALRSLLLGLAVWLGLRVFRVRSPHFQMTAWIVVLFASLAMPVLMRGNLTLTLPAATPALIKIERLPPERMFDVLTSPHLQSDVPAFLPPAAEQHAAASSPHIALPARIDWRRAADRWSLTTTLYLLVAGVMLFVGAGSAGEDVYEVRCENGSAEVQLDLLKDGRVGSVALGPE